MDSTPLVTRLTALIEATRLKADASVTQLAADVRQVLLATTVDIEQRWVFLTPEDRVDALTDLIALVMIYNRAFSDGADLLDALSYAVNKALTDTASAQDQAALAMASLLEDVASLNDTFSRSCQFARTAEDAVGTMDTLTTFLTLIRAYADSFAVNDAPAKEAGKVFEELGGLYTEAGYFADDYWQAEGPSPFDQATLALSTVATDTALLEDVLQAAVSFARAYAEFTTTTDASTLSSTLAKADTATPSDSTTYALDAAYADTAAIAEQAALDFATQMQELVAAAEGFARTVDFARSATESVTPSDTPAKTFTTSFADIGGLYAAVEYFADDYVEEGTGPAVYDSFTYALN